MGGGEGGGEGGVRGRKGGGDAEDADSGTLYTCIYNIIIKVNCIALLNSSLNSYASVRHKNTTEWKENHSRCFSFVQWSVLHVHDA